MSDNTRLLPPHPRDDEIVDLGPIAAQLELPPMTVAEWREVHRCEKCGHCSWDPDTDGTDEVTTPCEHGCCVVFRCACCGYYTSGAGAAGCPCDDGI